MKPFAQEIATQVGLARIGPLVQADINLTAATGNSTLITCAAGERFVLEAIELIPAAAGTFALLSAATRIATVGSANAGQEYVFLEKFGAANGDELILNRTDSIAIAGSITYRILTASP